MEFTVKVPVRVTAATEEEALAIAEKQYGKRPKKATIVEASLWPAALRPLIEKYNITLNGDRVKWGIVDGDTWLTNGYLATSAPGAAFDGEPWENIAKIPRGENNKPSGRVARRLEYQIGSALADRRFVEFVEELHGPCEWRSGRELEPVVAYRDGKWVATVATLRDSLTVGDARRRLEDAKRDASRAADVLGRAEKIRAAVAVLPEKEAAAKAAHRAASDAGYALATAQRLAREAKDLDAAEVKAASAATTIAECEAELRSFGITP